MRVAGVSRTFLYKDQIMFFGGQLASTSFDRTRSTPTVLSWFAWRRHSPPLITILQLSHFMSRPFTFYV